MADAKIEDLNELLTADPSDVLAIVDDPAGSPETKKITVTNLLSTAAGGASQFDATVGTGGDYTDIQAATPGIVTGKQLI